MEFGIQTRGDWKAVLETGRWAEDRGLVGYALPDHYLQRGDKLEEPAYDHLVHLAALAAETSRIELASLVSPVTFRHPAVLLKMGITIDDISGGRFTLGLGAGWLEEEFTSFGLPYPDLAVRMSMYEEAMAYLRAAIEPGATGFEGEHYRLAEFDPHPRPTRLRLMGGGAGGPKARRIAAKYGDEYNLYATTPERFAEIRKETRALATGLGRDPDEISWSTSSPALAAKSEDDYQALLEHLAKRTKQDPDHIEKTYAERGWPHGSGSRAAEMLAALEEAGCERYYAQMFFEQGDPIAFDIVMDAYQG